MNVAIIIFSPTGGTLRAGIMLEKCLTGKNITVQLINITRSKIFKDKNIKSYLKEIIGEHDILCIGSPVYAHHLHYNIKKIIKSLPRTGNGWGGLAVPFVTYGGINSGVALLEASRLLKRSGRKVISGMKLNAEHCMTKLKEIGIKLNADMPGNEALPEIQKLADRMLYACRENKNTYEYITKKFNYQSVKVRIKASLIFREKFWQRYMYPKLLIDYSKCTNCGKCVMVCPVQRIEINGKGPEIPKGNPGCIHCASCCTACPNAAMSFKADFTKWENLLSKAAKGEGPMPSNEFPKSEVF